DSDNDGCFDTVEAGHTDGDNDGILGNSPVSVDANGQVTGQGGYTGVTGNEIIATDFTITSSPSNQTIVDGFSVNFEVNATATNTTSFISGAPDYAGTGSSDSSSNINYQWQENGIDLNNGPNYEGVNTRALTINDVTGLSGNSYTVNITHLDNSCVFLTQSAILNTIDACNPMVSGFPDSDGDGISDYCDLD
ncbi:unnamed protein product, partial [Ectocarpus sp. 12 AP-2014]